MENFFTQLKNAARTLRLSHDEKQVMRVQLHTYFENNPVGNFAAPQTIARPTKSPFFFFSPRYMVPIALLLVVGLGSGTAFAAEGALPGNPLYAIKINVNEAVQTALATSPEAKAQVNAALATNRLEEAETLAANGTLDATTTAALASNFTAHANAAQAVTTALKSHDPGTAAQLGADFNSTLAAHGAILTQIAGQSKSDETTHNSNVLAMEVQHEVDQDNQDNQDGQDNQGDSVVAIATAVSIDATATAPTAPQTGARIRSFVAIAPTAVKGTAASTSSSTLSIPKIKVKSALQNTTTSNNSNNAKIADSLATQASTSIAAMTTDYAAISQSLDSNTSAQVAAQIDAVNAAYASAAAELAAGNTSRAVRDFTTAIHTAIKLDAYFKAGKQINIKLLSGLLNVSAVIKTQNEGAGSSGGNDTTKTPDSGDHGGSDNSGDNNN